MSVNPDPTHQGGTHGSGISLSRRQAKLEKKLTNLRERINDLQKMLADIAEELDAKDDEHK